jgi:hypothetical protein
MVIAAEVSHIPYIVITSFIIAKKRQDHMRETVKCNEMWMIVFTNLILVLYHNHLLQD